MPQHILNEQLLDFFQDSNNKEDEQTILERIRYKNSGPGKGSQGSLISDSDATESLSGGK